MAGLFTYLFASLLLGIFICFWGKKIYIPFLCITSILAIFSITVTKFGFNFKGILIALALSFVLCLSLGFILRLGLFLMGAVCGGLLGSFGVSFLHLPAASHVWIIVVLAVLLGLCCAIWRDCFIFAVTAYTGSSIMVKLILFFVINLFNLQSFVYADGSVATFLKLNEYLNSTFIAENATIFLFATLIVTVFGYLYQKKNT